MRKYITACLLALLLFCARGTAFELAVHPKNPKGGEGFLLVIKGTDTYKITYRDKEYAPYPAGKRRQEIYLPVGIEDRGVKKITVNDKTITIKVIARKLHRVHLTEKDEKMRSDQQITDQQNNVILDTLHTASPEKLWSKGFYPPVKGRVETHFAQKREGSTYNYYHKGLDLCGAKGSPVAAPSAGKVIYIGKNLNVYGNMLILDHGQGITSCYFHLDSTAKETGDSVKKGEVIACVGSTGWATGPHLHFGVYIQGDAVDPQWWYKFSRKTWK